jgi:hypothetical protein
VNNCNLQTKTKTEINTEINTETKDPSTPVSRAEENAREPSCAQDVCRGMVGVPAGRADYA